MLTGGDMAEICRTSLLQAMSTTRAWNDAIADEVIRKEDAVDHYEDVLGTYLVKLSAKHLSVRITAPSTRCCTPSATLSASPTTP